MVQLNLIHTKMANIETDGRIRRVLSWSIALIISPQTSPISFNLIICSSVKAIYYSVSWFARSIISNMALQKTKGLLLFLLYQWQNMRKHLLSNNVSIPSKLDQLHRVLRFHSPLLEPSSFQLKAKGPPFVIPAAFQILY